MLTKKKNIIILVFVVAALSGYYFFQEFRFQKTETLDLGSENMENNSDAIDDADNTIQNNGGENEANYAAPEIEVKTSDCDNDCSKFKKGSEKEYCQEICGTETYFEDAEEQGGSSDDCTDAKGIQKDYCLKDIAVGNKDFKICEEIKDANIKKSCQNRITEDILDNMEAPE